jgi:sec-independent protein translocase protein TatA
MNFGTGEIIMLGVILVIVFSASQMGALGNALGRFVHSFKKASQGEGFVDGKATRIDRPAHKPNEKGSEDAQITEPPKH